MEFKAPRCDSNIFYIVHLIIRTLKSIDHTRTSGKFVILICEWPSEVSKLLLIVWLNNRTDSLGGDEVRWNQSSRFLMSWEEEKKNISVSLEAIRQNNGP